MLGFYFFFENEECHFSLSLEFEEFRAVYFLQILTTFTSSLIKIRNIDCFFYELKIYNTKKSYKSSLFSSINFCFSILSARISPNFKFGFKSWGGSILCHFFPINWSVLWMKSSSSFVFYTTIVKMFLTFFLIGWSFCLFLTTHSLLTSARFIESWTFSLSYFLDSHSLKFSMNFWSNK